MLGASWCVSFQEKNCYLVRSMHMIPTSKVFATLFVTIHCGKVSCEMRISSTAHRAAVTQMFICIGKAAANTKWWDRVFCVGASFVGFKFAGYQRLKCFGIWHVLKYLLFCEGALGDTTQQMCASCWRVELELPHWYFTCLPRDCTKQRVHQRWPYPNEWVRATEFGERFAAVWGMAATVFSSLWIKQ